MALHQTSIQRVACCFLAAALCLPAAAAQAGPGSSGTDLATAIARARSLAARAVAAIKAERIARGIPIDEAVDPTKSGLIGVPRSIVTTVHGNLRAKQRSLDPRFISLAVKLLWRAGVRRGDVVAGNLSGSFPALNIAVLCAMEALGATSALISSVGASQWGANHPRLLWSDMESLLAKRGIVHLRSVSMTLGGTNDRGAALTRAGRRLLRQSVRAAGVPLLEVKGYADSLQKRVATHLRHSGKKGVKAYVNVGGNTVSVGGPEGKRAFRVGLNRRAPKHHPSGESVMSNLARRGIPVLHFVYIAKLMKRYQRHFASPAATRVEQGRRSPTSDEGRGHSASRR